MLARTAFVASGLFFRCCPMSDNAMDTLPDRLLAERYRWFCRTGWKEPTLNDPKVILGVAAPDEIDRLIADGMKRWPSKSSRPCPTPTAPLGSVA